MKKAPYQITLFTTDFQFSNFEEKKSTGKYLCNLSAEELFED